MEVTQFRCVCIVRLDVEKDLNSLVQWVKDMEKYLLALKILPQWSPGELRARLAQHQVGKIGFMVEHM